MPIGTILRGHCTRLSWQTSVFALFHVASKICCSLKECWIGAAFSHGSQKASYRTRFVRFYFHHEAYVWRGNIKLYFVFTRRKVEGITFQAYLQTLSAYLQDFEHICKFSSEFATFRVRISQSLK